MVGQKSKSIFVKDSEDDPIVQRCSQCMDIKEIRYYEFRGTRGICKDCVFRWRDRITVITELQSRILHSAQKNSDLCFWVKEVSQELGLPKEQVKSAFCNLRNHKKIFSGDRSRYIKEVDGVRLTTQEYKAYLVLSSEEFKLRAHGNAISWAASRLGISSSTVWGYVYTLKNKGLKTPSPQERQVFIEDFIRKECSTNWLCTKDVFQMNERFGLGIEALQNILAKLRKEGIDIEPGAGCKAFHLYKELGDRLFKRSHLGSILSFQSKDFALNYLLKRGKIICLNSEAKPCDRIYKKVIKE